MSTDETLAKTKVQEMLDAQGKKIKKAYLNLAYKGLLAEGTSPFAKLPDEYGESPHVLTTKEYLGMRFDLDRVTAKARDFEERVVLMLDYVKDMMDMHTQILEELNPTSPKLETAKEWFKRFEDNVESMTNSLYGNRTRSKKGKEEEENVSECEGGGAS